jgi:hypothetical protein
VSGGHELHQSDSSRCAGVCVTCITSDAAVRAHSGRLARAHALSSWTASCTHVGCTAVLVQSLVHLHMYIQAQHCWTRPALITSITCRQVPLWSNEFTRQVVHASNRKGATFSAASGGPKQLPADCWSAVAAQWGLKAAQQRRHDGCIHHIGALVSNKACLLLPLHPCLQTTLLASCRQHGSTWCPNGAAIVPICFYIDDTSDGARSPSSMCIT